MIIDRSSDFARWTGRLVEKAKAGDRLAYVTAQYVQDEIEYLKQLPEPPAKDTASLKYVRQSKRHPVWRLSHPFDKQVAVRVICWFDPATRVAVVALFGVNKKEMGDVFYDSVGSRADQIIDQWLKQREGQR